MPRGFLAVMGAFLACGFLARPAAADALVLTSGGEVRGELQAEGGPRRPAAAEAPVRYTLRMLDGSLVSVAREDVAEVIRRRPVLEEYETLRRAAPDTVEGQWELSEWCRRKYLATQRAEHLERVVALDADHIAAHRGLGHVHHEGRWTTREEMMTARGYVRYKGKFVLPQELEILEEEGRASDAEKEWFQKLKMWQAWLGGDKAIRQAEALRELKSIRDPDAVPAIARTFRSSPQEAQRLLMVDILSRIEGDKPLGPLVQQSLKDDEKSVRQAAVRGVRARNVGLALPIYVRSLRNGMNEYVNRAASALGELGDKTVVPQLIESLVTRHQYRVQVPDTSAISIGADGSLANSGAVLPPDVEMQLRTGQLPYGVNVSGVPVRTKEVTVERDEQNPAVLTALQHLTGEDFGFDESAWRRWYRAQQAGAPKTRRSSRS